MSKKREENTESLYVEDACHDRPHMRRLTLKHFFVLWISGVSAQSFIHAFTLTHSVFNVQIATPQVRKIINQLRAVISISLGHSFSILASAPIDRGTLNFTPSEK